jgi:hypothetical protein
MINTTATSYSIIRKWIVKDACNNTSEFIQAVNVAVVRTDIAVTEIKSYNIDDITYYQPVQFTAKVLQQVEPGLVKTLR